MSENAASVFLPKLVVALFLEFRISVEQLFERFLCLLDCFVFLGRSTAVNLRAPLNCVFQRRLHLTKVVGLDEIEKDGRINSAVAFLVVLVRTLLFVGDNILRENVHRFFNLKNY